MVKDADARFDEVEAQNELAGTEGRMFKLKHDMSVVGPRPPLPREVERYEREHLHRLRGMPGITGLWQTSGRSDLDFEDMVRLDRYYLDNWSIRLDLDIIIKTVFVVLGRKGAY
jgi:lipopolysaccharide/colanic/teichoic acid biosynthesis glycosyltransferase